MLSKDKRMLLCLAMLLAGFGYGVLRLFQLRFDTGDIYPAYSSLRADPIGTKALYESLETLPGLTVQRHIRPIHRLPKGQKTALFIFGADASEMTSLTEDEFEALERFMFEGGRIVVSFFPANTKSWTVQRQEAREEKKKSPDKRKPGGNPTDSTPRKKKKNFPGEEEDWPGMKLISLKDRWAIEFAYSDLPKNEEGDYQSVEARRTAESELPRSILWHTALYFHKPDVNWQEIYARENRPVLVERKFGRGSLVFSADSFYLSNEALRKERHPELLAWLVGPNRTVLFEESHHGVTETPGIAALIRKYRLHGFVIGLVLLAGLFVWKNAVSFVPPPDETAAGRDDLVVGRESGAGFVNLLRRSIRPAEVLSVCFAEWKKSCVQGRSDVLVKVERLGKVLKEHQSMPPRQKNPVETYQEMSRILSERSEFRIPSSEFRVPGSELTTSKR